MNPFLKSLLTAIAGAALPVLDAAVQTAHPSGGFAATLNSNSAYAMLYGVGLITAHNLLTSFEAGLGIHPAQTADPAPQASSVKPAK